MNLTNFGTDLKSGVKVTLDLLKQESVVGNAAFTLLHLKTNNI